MYVQFKNVGCRSFEGSFPDLSALSVSYPADLSFEATDQLIAADEKRDAGATELWGLTVQRHKLAGFGTGMLAVAALYLLVLVKDLRRRIVREPRSAGPLEEPWLGFLSGAAAMALWLGSVFVLPLGAVWRLFELGRESSAQPLVLMGAVVLASASVAIAIESSRLRQAFCL